MIKLEKVSKFYASGDNNVSLGLHNVSLEMKKGEIVGIVGESGSGKSTFLNVCSLLDTYEDGEIYYDGTPVSSFSPEEIDEFRKNHIGFIFQNYNLIDSYTVLQNVLMPLIIKGVNPKDAKIKAKEIIKRVGLENRMNHKGTRLSGGEKQRCVIARALASDSEILACDEPTGNLDSKTGREIIELIKEVASDKLVLIVTHNYDELSDIITRRLTFADGNLIEDVNLKEKEDCVDTLKPNGEYKIKFKERLKLSCKDILSTPRKTLLTFVIFLAISTFIAYLYTALLTFKNSYTEDSIYDFNVSDRYIITERDKPFDFDDFEGYDVNKYGEAEDAGVRIATESLERGFAYIRFSMPKVKLKKGHYPTKDDEVVLGIPESSLTTCYNETITFDFILGNNYENKYAKYDKFVESDGVGYRLKPYKVVGYYVINDTSFNNYIVSGLESFNNDVIETYRYKKGIMGRLRCEIYTTLYGELKLNDSLADNTINLILPSEYEGKYNDITKGVNLVNPYSNNDIDETIYNYTVTYRGANFIVEANAFTLRSIADQAEHFLSAYETNQVKLDKLIDHVSDKGYSICNAREAYIVEDISFSSILNTILYAFFIVGIIFAFVVIFLISYFILARIYSIKNKDYTVFRTLGMSKKDMASLVRMETVILSLSSAVLLLIIVGISYILKFPIIRGFHRVGIMGIIFYLVFMFVYSLFFAIRFNRKLYKFSVSKTFRGGVLGND